MGQTYESSAWTLIWLGKAYNTTEKVVSMFKQIEEIGGDSIRATMGRMRGYQPSWLPNLGFEEPEEEQDWLEFIYFFMRSWFTRVWTLQESILPSTVCYFCGQFWITWDTMEEVTTVLSETRLLEWLRETANRDKLLAEGIAAPSVRHSLLAGLVDGELTAEGWSRLFNAWYNVTSPSDSTAALFAYATFCSSGFECMDLRDQVFALLSISKRASRYGSGKPLAIEANYRKSVVEVYTEAISFILNETGCLTPLLRSCKPSALQEKLPSWVLSFDSKQWRTLLDMKSDEERDDFVPYNASRDTFLGFKIVGNALTIYHHVHATVAHVGESWDEMGHTTSIQKIAELLLLRVMLHPKRRLWADDLRKTMLCGLKGEYECDEEESRLSFRCFVALMMTRQILRAGKGRLDQLRLLGKFAEADDTSTIPHPITVMDQFELDEHEFLDQMRKGTTVFEHTIRRSYPGRRIFLLDNGDIGLGHELLEPGDALCIVADGGRTPVILRKTDSEYANSWRWIGEAYVQNIMFGEAVDLMEQEGKTWKQAIII